MRFESLIDLCQTTVYDAVQSQMESDAERFGVRLRNCLQFEPQELLASMLPLRLHSTEQQPVSDVRVPLNRFKSLLRD